MTLSAACAIKLWSGLNANCSGQPLEVPRIDAAVFIYSLFSLVRRQFEGGVYHVGKYMSAPRKQLAPCVDKLVRRYGSYKIQSRNTQNEQLTMVKIRQVPSAAGALSALISPVSLCDKVIHTGRGRW